MNPSGYRFLIGWSTKCLFLAALHCLDERRGRRRGDQVQGYQELALEKEKDSMSEELGSVL